MFGLPIAYDSILRGVVLGIGGLFVVIVIVRLVGLRSFSKMTSFDFVITLAMGSLLATVGTMSEWTVFLQVVSAIATLMTLQVVLALLHRRAFFRQIIQNDPLMLMRDGVFDEAAMKRSRVSQADILAKVRGANVHDLSKVRAVVLETTGDISVMHGDTIDERLLGNVLRS